MKSPRLLVLSLFGLGIALASSGNPLYSGMPTSMYSHGFFRGPVKSITYSDETVKIAPGGLAASTYDKDGVEYESVKVDPDKRTVSSFLAVMPGGLLKLMFTDTYDDAGCRVKTTDYSGSVTSRTCNSKGQILTATTEADIGTFQEAHSWSADGLSHTWREFQGKETGDQHSEKLNAHGDPIEQTSQLENKVSRESKYTYIYDEQGNWLQKTEVTTSTIPLGLTSSRTKTETRTVSRSITYY